MSADTPPDPLEVAADFTRAWNAHDLDAALALVTDDCVFESANPLTFGPRLQGKDTLREAWRPGFEHPGGSFEIERMFTAGDHVVQQWRFVSDALQVRGVDLLLVHDGRIAEKLGYVKTGG